MMNPSVSEEAGETARTLVSTMKDSPLTLALVIFNVIFISTVFWLARENRAANNSMITELIKQQEKTQEMLYNCTPNKPN